MSVESGLIDIWDARNVVSTDKEIKKILDESGKEVNSVCHHL